MDDIQRVDRHFQDLIRRDESAWSRSDRVINWIIATRCEMDMNGFDNVFNQLLTKHDLQFLIESFTEIDEPSLAQNFTDARDRLESDQDTEAEFLADIEEQVRDNDQLWELDTKLATLIRAQAK